MLTAGDLIVMWCDGKPPVGYTYIDKNTFYRIADGTELLVVPPREVILNQLPKKLREKLIEAGMKAGDRVHVVNYKGIRWK